MTMEAMPGVDQAPVTEWLLGRVAAAPPLEFTLIAGGHSNLTFVVRDRAGARWVLRRPPLGHVLPTAHDMTREHRILAALQPTEVPVPRVVGLCADTAVTGAPFYVMEYVDGHVLRERADAERLLPAAARTAAGRNLVDVLARLHHVDPDRVGLGDLGRREGYLARQLQRWSQQWLRSKDRDLPAVDEAHRRLVRRIPTEQAVGVVHGDFRLDNCIVDSAGGVRAVLDWELCTLGDVLADVGVMLVYWAQDDDPVLTSLGRPTTAAGFPHRRELVERYARETGWDLSGIDFYVAFGYWKLACILQGVYVRYVAGAMGQGGDAVAEMPGRIVELAEAAVARLE